MENSDEKNDETIFTGGREPRFIDLDTAEEWLLEICQFLKIDLPDDPLDFVKVAFPEGCLDLDSLDGLATSQAVAMWMDLVYLREFLETGSDQEKLGKHFVMELAFGIANKCIALIQAAAAKAKLDESKGSERNPEETKAAPGEFFRKALVMGEWESILRSGVPLRAGQLKGVDRKTKVKGIDPVMQAGVLAKYQEGRISWDQARKEYAKEMKRKGVKGFSVATLKRKTKNPRNKNP